MPSASASRMSSKNSSRSDGRGVGVGQEEGAVRPGPDRSDRRGVDAVLNASAGTSIVTGAWLASERSASSRQVVFSARRRVVRSRSTVAAANPARKRGASSIHLPFWLT